MRFKKFYIVITLFFITYLSLIALNFDLNNDFNNKTELREVNSSSIWDYTGSSYYIGDQDVFPEGFYWDGIYWWMIGSDSDEVYKYNSEWGYMGVSYDISGQCTTPTDIFWDGYNWWVLGDGVFDSVYQYYSNWTYTGNSHYLGSQEPAPKGIFWDGMNWWVVGLNNRVVYKYTSDWAYTGTSYFIGTQDGYPSDLFWDGNNWWVPGINSDTIYLYYSNWSYTGNSYYLGTLDTYPTDIIWNGMHWYMLGYENSRVYQYYGEPSIVINDPTPYNLFNSIAPYFNVTINDSDGISAQWYTINEGMTKYQFIGSTGFINQTSWELQGNGTVSIRFYANDSLGNIAFSEIIVRKDTQGPIININTPTTNQLYGTGAPSYAISILEHNLDKVWYTFNNLVSKIFITELNGTTDQNLWEQVPNGHVTIRFYANDTLGNKNFNEVVVVKDSPVEGIPGYDLFILFGIISVVIVSIGKKLKGP